MSKRDIFRDPESYVVVNNYSSLKIENIFLISIKKHTKFTLQLSLEVETYHFIHNNYRIRQFEN